jgi:hypothetical protein
VRERADAASLRPRNAVGRRKKGEAMPHWLQIMLAVYLVAGTLYFLRGTGASR